MAIVQFRGFDLLFTISFEALVQNLNHDLPPADGFIIFLFFLMRESGVVDAVVVDDVDSL